MLPLKKERGGFEILMHKNGLLTDKLSLNEKHKPIHYISASEDLLTPFQEGTISHLELLYEGGQAFLGDSFQSG
uniref:Uncharacterized protein n=1 Tax=Cannabis sativa TaxID=3483 RepID=A0A803PS06_CANSA